VAAVPLTKPFRHQPLHLIAGLVIVRVIFLADGRIVRIDYSQSVKESLAYLFGIYSRTGLSPELMN